jgi:hypothetical protein
MNWVPTTLGIGLDNSWSLKDPILKNNIKRMGKLNALLVWMQTSGQHLLNIGENTTHRKRPPDKFFV